LAAVATAFLALALFSGVAHAGDDYPVTTTTQPDPTTTTVDEIDVERATVEADTLPRTGSDIAPWVITGVVLLAVGGGIIFLTRRHASQATDAS